MQLSVAKALQDKNPGLYKKIPSFVIRWVERLICQDEMNMLLREHGHLSSLGFTNAVIDYLDNELEIHHEENIPRTGRYIIASNHPLGGLDGMTLISVCGRYRQSGAVFSGRIVFPQKERCGPGSGMEENHHH